MKQVIFGSVLSLLLFGFFVYQAGGIAAGGTNGAITGNGGVSASGNTTNGKNAANANGDNIGNTTGLAIPGED